MVGSQTSEGGTGWTARGEERSGRKGDEGLEPDDCSPTCGSLNSENKTLVIGNVICGEDRHGRAIV